MQNPHIEMKYKMINNARSVSDGYKWNGDSSRLKLSHTGLTSPSERHPLCSALFWCWCHIEFDFRSITDSAMCGSAASFCVTWLCTNLPEMLCQMSASWFCTKKKVFICFYVAFSMQRCSQSLWKAELAIYFICQEQIRRQRSCMLGDLLFFSNINIMSK